MSASRKAGYYWVKYVSQNHWSIEYWNGGMWFTRNSHLVEDSMFSTIDETPIVREQKESEQQCNCNLPNVSNNNVAVCEKKNCTEPVYEFGLCFKHYCISEEH